MPTLPTLPPPDEEPATLLALSGVAAQRYHLDTLTALVDALNPDAVIATDPAASSLRPILGSNLDVPVLQAGVGMAPDTVSVCDDAIVVAATAATSTPTPETVDESLDHPNPTDTANHTVLITSDLSLSVDPYRRTTTLDGAETYYQNLPERWRGDDATHLSTSLRPGFQTEYTHSPTAEPMTVVGVGRSEAKLGVGADDTDATATVVEVYSNGAIDTREIDPETFGLRGVPQVGQKRAKALRSAGISTPEQVVDTSLSSLADVDGLGRTTVQTIQAAAEAITTRTVIPTGDDALPNGEPVFIDIETDGLNPSTAWLIGVLDGDAEDGTYLAFREDHPGDGAHLEAFMTWLTESAAGRPVVAWNGYGFDFPVIEDQLRQHCPEYVEEWQDTYCFDALWWARDKNGGNAALPGRSNKLEPVAEALGWEPSSNGIDGATVAETYVAWRGQVERAETPSDVDAPDWKRLERYCEDDVRALATIYEALGDAARRAPETSSPTGENSTQGALSDFT